MVIGSVLLQPQRLERASQVPSDDAVLNDIISLAVRLMIDAVRGGRLGDMLAGSLAGTVARLTMRAGAGVNSAVTRFGALFAPLVAPIQAAAEQPPGEVGALMDELENGLTSVVNVLKNLTPDQLRQGMSTVFGILETDLGITPTFIRDVVRGFFDDLILALGSAPPDETPDERGNRRAVAALLGRIKRYIQANFIFPAWNADIAAQALLTLRQRLDVDATLTRALCSGAAAVTYLRTGRTLIDLLPYSAFPPFGEGNLGAAAAQPAREDVSFYASKLLEYDNYDGDLGELPLSPDEIMVDGATLPLLREAFLHASVVLARSAFLHTVDENESWKVVDRKKYVISRANSQQLAVYRLFEISLPDFLNANQGDRSKLRKIFRENGIPLLSTSTFTVQVSGSNTWAINVGGSSFVGTSFEGKITIRPATLAGVLLTLPIALQPATTEKAPAPALRQAFGSENIPLSPRCSLSMREPGSEWLLDDGDFAYTITKEEGKFKVSTGDFLGWLRSTIGKPKGDMVWVNRERTQVLLGQRIMHMGSNVSWQDAPIFKRLKCNRHYSLKNKADTLEGWAYHASWVQDTVNSLFPAIEIGIWAAKGKVLSSIGSSILEIGRMTSEMVVKRAQRRPMSELVGIGFWYDLLLDAGIGIVKIIESALEPSNPPTTASDFSKAVDFILKVADVEVLDAHWSELAYEFILSLLTLVNHEEPAQKSQKRPENYKESGGFVDLFWHGGLLAYTAAIPDSEYVLPNSEYALPFQTTSLTAGYWLGGALGVGLVMGFVGLLVGQGAVAKVNVFADAAHLRETLGKSMGKSLLYFWPYLKLLKRKEVESESA